MLVFVSNSYVLLFRWLDMNAMLGIVERAALDIRKSPMLKVRVFSRSLFS